MCGKVKIHKLLASPGDTLNIKIKSNQTIPLRWGINMSDKLLYNTRYESLVRKSFWRSMLLNHCILETNGFFEGIRLFRPLNGEVIGLAGIYKPNEGFTILTMPAGDIIKFFHHRQPILIYPHEYNIYLEGRKLSKFIKENSNKIQIL